MLRKILKRVLSPFLTFWWKGYTEKSHIFKYKGLTLTLLPSVFHPVFFFSTKVLLGFLETQTVKDKKIWELGAGNGLISMVCARRGGGVLATDINPKAIEGIIENVKQNGLSDKVTAICADLFNELPVQIFDIILINPPYYPQNPKNMGENAFFCGENFDFFVRFFKEISSFTDSRTLLFMILSEDCALAKIAEIADKNEWKMTEVHRKTVMGERNLIFRIEKKPA